MRGVGVQAAWLREPGRGLDQRRGGVNDRLYRFGVGGMEARLWGVIVGVHELCHFGKIQFKLTDSLNQWTYQLDIMAISRVLKQMLWAKKTSKRR